MPSNCVVIEIDPTKSEHSADPSSLQLMLKITHEVRLKIRGQTSPATAKTAEVTLGTELHLWNTDPSAARSDLSQKFASLGVDSQSQQSLIQSIEKRVGKCDGMLAFKVDIRVTYIKLYSSLEAKNGDGYICSICLEETAEGGAITRCGHVFHGHCIAMWLYKSASCPLCRSTCL